MLKILASAFFLAAPSLCENVEEPPRDYGMSTDELKEAPLATYGDDLVLLRHHLPSLGEKPYVHPPFSCIYMYVLFFMYVYTPF